MTMLTELCTELKNWDFIKGADKYFRDEIVIFNGRLQGFDDVLVQGQYFRIVGSLFNDGVYQYPASGLTKETFNGAIWAMAIPPEVIALAEDIASWKAMYGNVDSEAMSPYQSESYGGYSYNKGGAGTDGKAGVVTWQQVFAPRLNKWRKIR